VRRTSKLILALYTISILLHTYIGVRLISDIASWPWLQWALLMSLTASAYLVPAAMIQSRKSHTLMNTLIVWAGLIFMGYLSSLIVFTLVRDILIASLWLADQFGANNLLSKTWLSISAVGVVVAGLIMSLIGFLNTLFGPRVVHVDVPIKNLATELDGFRIAQLSDVHIGPTIKSRFLRKVVAKVNKLHVDVVAITGDLVDGRVEHLQQHVQPLADLQSTYGSFFVTGNHEYYSNALEWVDCLQQLNLRVLLNEHELITHKHVPVLIAGITDYSAHQFHEEHRSDPHQAKAGAPTPNSLRVLLAHQPRSIFAASEAGYDLQLSGHTHGGQFWPWNHFVPLQQPFTSGLHWYKNMWIYVSRGTGYWGPPKRFGAPSEITLIRIVTAKASQ
jgi:predicted MPP superfamily phosphohydrolase